MQSMRAQKPHNVNISFVHHNSARQVARSRTRKSENGLTGLFLRKAIIGKGLMTLEVTLYFYNTIAISIWGVLGVNREKQLLSSVRVSLVMSINLCCVI